jgi:hypothetical protein
MDRDRADAGAAVADDRVGSGPGLGAVVFRFTDATTTCSPTPIYTGCTYSSVQAAGGHVGAVGDTIAADNADTGQRPPIGSADFGKYSRSVVGRVRLLQVIEGFQQTARQRPARAGLEFGV